MDLFGKSPRPVFNNTMLQQLANEIGKQVFEWCQDNDTDLEECVDTCLEVMDGYNLENGYVLAKEFEDRGYEPDLELVQILDTVQRRSGELEANAVEKWVIDDYIQPEFKVGTNVMVKFGKTVEGIITGYYEKIAKYKVCIPSEGMTMDGSRRAIIKYEDAKEIVNEVTI